MKTKQKELWEKRHKNAPTTRPALGLLPLPLNFVSATFPMSRHPDTDLVWSDGEGAKFRTCLACPITFSAISRGHERLIFHSPKSLSAIPAIDIPHPPGKVPDRTINFHPPLVIPYNFEIRTRRFGTCQRFEHWQAGLATSSQPTISELGSMPVCTCHIAKTRINQHLSPLNIFGIPIP